ncbi:MAG: hypothetical protein IT364_02165 [Candidatus Hydrogenedentes bacterium]|nr:hypothetical protein [Candidatus Hydrogenedentota bacterium]
MKTPCMRFIPFALLLAALTCCGCNPDRGKLVFEPGLNGPRMVETSDRVSMKVKVVALDMAIETVKDLTYSMMPKSIDNEGAVTLDVTYESVHFEAKGLGGLFDGIQGLPNVPKPEALQDPFGIVAIQQSLDALKGETFTVVVNHSGVVASVTGADAIAAKIADAMTIPAHLSREEMRERVLKAYGDEGTRAILQNVFTQGPGKKLNPGDIWQETLTRADLPFPLEAERTYTLRARAEGVLTVDTKTQFTLALISDETEDAGAEPKSSRVELSGEGTGAIQIEEPTGWPIEGNVTAQVRGGLTLVRGLQFPLEATITSTLRSYPKYQPAS